MRAKNLPLRLNSKTGSKNVGMPHEGCRQNRSTVSQTPVRLGHFQSSTFLSFYRQLSGSRSAQRPDTILLHLGVPPEGQKRADPFTRGLGAENSLLAISR